MILASFSILFVGFVIGAIVPIDIEGAAFWTAFFWGISSVENPKLRAIKVITSRYMWSAIGTGLLIKWGALLLSWRPILTFHELHWTILILFVVGYLKEKIDTENPKKRLWALISVFLFSTFIYHVYLNVMTKEISKSLLNNQRASMLGMNILQFIFYAVNLWGLSFYFSDRLKKRNTV